MIKKYNFDQRQGETNYQYQKRIYRVVGHIVWPIIIAIIVVSGVLLLV